MRLCCFRALPECFERGRLKHGIFVCQVTARQAMTTLRGGVVQRVRQPARQQQQQTKCGKCGTLGHSSGQCPEHRGSSCHSCGKPGHFSRECPAARKCFNCHQPGHISEDCPDDPRVGLGGWTTDGMQPIEQLQIGQFNEDNAFEAWQCFTGTELFWQANPSDARSVHSLRAASCLQRTLDPSQLRRSNNRLYEGSPRFGYRSGTFGRSWTGCSVPT